MKERKRKHKRSMEMTLREVVEFIKTGTNPEGKVVPEIHCACVRVENEDGSYSYMGIV